MHHKAPSASLYLLSSASTASLFMSSLLADPLYHANAQQIPYTMNMANIIPPPVMNESTPPLFLMITYLHYFQGYESA